MMVNLKKGSDIKATSAQNTKRTRIHTMYALLVFERGKKETVLDEGDRNQATSAMRTRQSAG